MDDRKEGVSASGNFLTYAQTALDTWNERPFCAVDSLVLSGLPTIGCLPIALLLTPGRASTFATFCAWSVASP